MSMFTFSLSGLGGLTNFFSNLEDLNGETWWVGTNVRYAAAVHEKHSTQSRYLSRAVQEINFEQARQGVNQIIDPSSDVNDATQIVRGLAFELEGRGKQLAPVDTGNLQNSIAAGPSVNDMMAKSEQQQT